MTFTDALNEAHNTFTTEFPIDNVVLVADVQTAIFNERVACWKDLRTMFVTVAIMSFSFMGLFAAVCNR